MSDDPVPIETGRPMLEDGVGLQIWFSEPAEKYPLTTLDGIWSI